MGLPWKLFRMSESPDLNDTREREEEEARGKRIESYHQAGRVFESLPDLQWLYLDLALRGQMIGSIENDLEDFICEPIRESLLDDGSREQIFRQTARYVDNPKFHCTALRDFLIIKLTEGLITGLADPVKEDMWVLRIVFLLPVLLLVAVLAAVLYIFVNWWSAAALIAALFIVKAWSWLRESFYYRLKVRLRNHYSRKRLKEIVRTIERGGFDEQTIIRQLEIFDAEIPPLPKLVHVYGLPYLLGSDQSGIQHTIEIPSVLYALLRLPRRNVESELSMTFHALEEAKKRKLHEQWREFVERMLRYDEPLERAMSVEQAASDE